MVANHVLIQTQHSSLASTDTEFLPAPGGWTALSLGILPVLGNLPTQPGFQNQAKLFLIRHTQLTKAQAQVVLRGNEDLVERGLLGSVPTCTQRVCHSFALFPPAVVE